jgi:hypothetical protein
MITEDESLLLTEKPFFRAEIGKTYVLVLANWRYELRDNMFDSSKKDKKHTFIASVLRINDESPKVRKDLITSNTQLNAQLVPIVLRAQRYNAATVTIELTRVDTKNYQVVDVGFIRASLSNKDNKGGNEPSMRVELDNLTTS